MDEPDRSSADRPPDARVAALPEAVWVRDLPPPPFVDPTAQPGTPRFAALSPRVAILIGATVVLGLLLWMARDNLRPFIGQARTLLALRKADPAWKALIDHAALEADAELHDSARTTKWASMSATAGSARRTLVCGAPTGSAARRQQ